MAWYDDYIAQKPGVQGGAPCVRGTRTPVRTIAIFYQVTFSRNIDEILTALPHLSRHQVEAALAYYDAHRAEIDADIERHREAARRVRSAS